MVNCPTITLAPSTWPNAVINMPYPAVITANPVGGNYTFGLDTGMLPTGLTLNSNGSFSGAPTQSGTFNFRITATGFGSCTGSLDYVLTVTCPTLTLAPPPNATAGTAYQQMLVASPPAGAPYTFTHRLDVATGLTLTSAGLLSGIPTTTGTFNFMVTVTGFGAQCSTAVPLSISVTCAVFSLPGTLPNGVQGAAYNQSVAATPAGTYSYVVTSNALPPGLSLDSATGAITGTPTAAGSYAFGITVTGGSSCTKSQSYSISITNTCTTLTLNPSALPAATLGTAMLRRSVQQAASYRTPST